MKHRNGFVSNSSSSSFIVAFKELPNSERVLHALMFPEGERLVRYSKLGLGSRSIVARVFTDLSEPISGEEVVSIHSSQTDHREEALLFIERNKECLFFMFTYGGGGKEKVFEHGDIFESLPCLYISHH